MTRRTATAAAATLAAAYALIAAFWVWLGDSLHMPRHTVVAWCGAGALVAVLGIAAMLRTAERRDPFATPGEALTADDPDEHLRPLRQPSPGEPAYDTRMQRRGQFLSHQFVKPRRAAALAQKVTRRALAARRGATSPAPLSAPEAASPSVPSVSGSEDEAPTMNVPGRESAGPDRGAAQTPAGDLPAKRRGAHRQPRPERRWRGVGGFWRSPVGAPAWAYAPIPGPVGTALPPAVPVAAMVLSAPTPDSPARETPAPRPEPSGAPGQGLAPGDGEVAVLCAGCTTDDGHCDGEAPDCDCTCGLPPDWAEATRAEASRHEENTFRLYEQAGNEPEYLPDGLAEPDWDESERSETPANACEHEAGPSLPEPTPEEVRERLARTADWPALVAAHEQAPATEEAPAELPGAEDCPGPLFPDWETGSFAAFVEAGETA